ncbi:hypothetical protein [Caballeronia sp. AAUFL_F2_KS46]|uniref:hypothetical protein n=1 Tax=Caballeronia sp. AAUFL_F2_KS46 TaxID=2921780 RepID=UPI00202865FC|nr:hypothetical protein [Caballeronia sp. AAUFL_F2_KS46]
MTSSAQIHIFAGYCIQKWSGDEYGQFVYVSDANAFLNELRERLAKFGLSLHPEKTRLIAFGRFVAKRRAAQGLSKPETFDFLGFTHICGKKRGGKGFQLWRKTKRKRKTETVKRIATELRHMRSSPIDEQGRWLAQVLRGHYAYFAVPTNLQAVRAVRHLVKIRWYLSLLRRSQRRRLTWRRMNVIVEKYLPMPRVLHPWPEQRFLVKHRR